MNTGLEGLVDFLGVSIIRLGKRNEIHTGAHPVRGKNEYTFVVFQRAEEYRDESIAVEVSYVSFLEENICFVQKNN